MKLFSSFVLVTGLALASFAYAQDPQQAPPSQNAPKVTVTGCLMKGANAGEYTVIEQKTSEKIPFTGPAQLDKYLNQTVKLVGTVAGQGQDKTFKPESIDSVAATCSKAQ